MIESFFVFALAIALGWPVGRYLAAVMRGDPLRLDRLFGLIERPLYGLLGVDPSQGMGWKTYAKAFLLSNLALGVIVWIVFMTQAWLPLNPNEAPNMRWDPALHTAVSFLTNTNQQHYSGQAQLSYFAQMTGIVGLQVATPMMGLALGDATAWWNLSCTVALALGRYPALILPLVIAALLARKRGAPEGAGALQIETPTFALTLIAVIAILTLLQFMPVLVLGPVAEHLALASH